MSSTSRIASPSEGARLPESTSVGEEPVRPYKVFSRLELQQEEASQIR